MRRVRVTCKTPPVQPHPPTGPLDYPLVTGRLPSLVDCRIFVVEADGSETEIPGVTSISWHVKSPNVATATIEVHGVELDAEALLFMTEPPG